MIVDTSVAVKWFIEEAHSREATRLLERPGLSAPRLIRLEVASALAKRVRGREFNADFARRLFQAFERSPIIVLEDEWVEPALDLSLALWTSLTDCVFLACAIERDELLVTADERFARSVRSRPELAERVVWIGEV